MTSLAARFRPGDCVRVQQLNQPGHVRTPCYIRGKVGKIESLAGSFRNPESLAYGGDGLPLCLLYRVSFRQSELWPTYNGSPRDCLCVDVYEHWLSSQEQDRQ